MIFPTQGIEMDQTEKMRVSGAGGSDRPLSAVQIYNRIEREHEGSDYAVSTIYRILATFEEHGMVEKTTFMGDGTVVYELNRGEHTHYAVCLECHKRIPLPSCPFAHVHLEQDTGDLPLPDTN